MMIKAMKEDLIELEEEEKSKDQFDVDSELQNHKKIKKKDLDEQTIVATAILMLIAGNFYMFYFLLVSYVSICKIPFCF